MLTGANAYRQLAEGAPLAVGFMVEDRPGSVQGADLWEQDIAVSGGRAGGAAHRCCEPAAAPRRVRSAWDTCMRLVIYQMPVVLGTQKYAVRVSRSRALIALRL